MDDRGSDALDGSEGLLPIKLSRIWVEADDMLSGPANKHAFAGLFDDDGRGIGGLVIEGPPFFLSSDFVKGDDAGVVTAADLDYDKVFLNQRCGGYAPNWHFYFVLGIEVLVPDDASLCCIETVQMSHSAERVSPIAVNSNRSTWAVAIADAFVHAFVGARPDWLAGHCIEAVDALELSWSSYAVGDIDAAGGDGWAAVAICNFGPQSRLQLRRVEFSNDTFFMPNAVSVRPSPLRPVFCASLGAKQHRCNQYQC